MYRYHHSAGGEKKQGRGLSIFHLGTPEKQGVKPPGRGAGIRGGRNTVPSGGWTGSVHPERKKTETGPKTMVNGEKMSYNDKCGFFRDELL